MDNAIYLPAGSLEARYLDASLNPGLIMAADGKTVFLILAEGSERWAAMVSQPECHGWKLEPNTRHWYGLYVPNVSVRVDIRQSQSDLGLHVRSGTMLVQGADMRLAFRAENRPFGHVVSLNSATAVTDEGCNPTVAFLGWQIGVWDRDGSYQLLFERQAGS